MTSSASNRTIQHLPDGTSLVPLSNRDAGSVAIVDTADLKLVQELGLSSRWARHPKSGTVVAPATLASGGHVVVARVILGAGPGENVSYGNGDPTDLRNENLSLVPGNAQRRDRDFLTPANLRRSWGTPVREVTMAS